MGVECAGDGDPTCKVDDASETIGRVVAESMTGGGGDGVDDAARWKKRSGDGKERVGVEVKASSSTDKVNMDGGSDVVGCGSRDNDNCDCGCDCGCGTGCVDDTEDSMVLRVDLASREGAPARGAAVCNNACAEDSNAAKDAEDAEDAEDASDGMGDTAVDGNAGSTGRFTGVAVETGDKRDEASGAGGRSEDEEESLSVEKSFEATVA